MLGIIGKNVKTEDHSESSLLGKDYFFVANKKLYENEQFSLLLCGTITNFLTEVRSEDNFSNLLELYQRYGNFFYKYIDGPFFIMLWDKSTQKLILANNRHQTSNLYYSFEDSTLYFSDSLEKINSALKSDNPFMPSIRSFLSNGFTYSDKTQIQNISKLLPTFSLIFEKGKLEVINHWDEEINFTKREITNLDDRLNEYENTYQNVLKSYLTKNVGKNIGCLLSGGHDTSFAAIQLSKLNLSKVSAYTVTFPNWAFNEEEHARNIAEKFGIDFCPVPFLPKHLDDIVELIHAVEEPVVGVALPLFILSMKAKEDGIDIIVGGDGGDTMWGEYYPVGEIHRYIKFLPLPCRKLLHLCSKALAKITDWERFWELEHVLSIFAQRDYYDQFMRKLCTYRHFNDPVLRDLFSPESYGGGEISRSILEVPFRRDNFNEALIEGKLFNAFYTYMGFSQTKLMKFLKIDFFMPTVQKPIIDFITALPSLWINGGNTFQRLTNNKKINRKFHKKALSRYLSKDEIYNRSFDIPWHLILRPREDILTELEHALIRRGWYNKTYLKSLFKEFKEQKVKEDELLELKTHGYRIFTLLSLEIWCQLFLDKKSYSSFDGNVSNFLRGHNE
ncbi:putative asparagine synthetase [Halobacteriovorax marinus SJ]|uniref:asparagine synthase (glutamine-hydrolyzing) n=1 Tax=Halobacteriovorax marinus (strain ATCC BAA-682 / DSM 15412 / SJ) TaxID=862908 RepID=E1WYW0_HALMS|nr:asparagine synthase-related protein [Halobacteriovorax marinus]CBW27751.1 putative asparagine synthetase [Halobacteriovorax marinus SJ]